AHDGGPLTLGGGKIDIVAAIRAQHRGRAMLIGDGSSDLEAGAAVDLFVGFGGVVARERVAAAAEVFIRAARLSAVLPLAIGRAALPAGFAALYDEGVEILRSQVRFLDPRLRAALL